MRKLEGFPYKKVLVLGLAKSGTAVSQLLHRQGIDVVVNDLKAQDDNPSVHLLRSLEIKVIIGDHPLDLLDDIDVIIKNPGIPYENPLLEVAQSKKIPILTEIELLHYLHVNDLIGITGSNGKTTTTTLISEMLKESSIPSRIAGNIGHVASEVAENLAENETMVVELSSFQLMGIEYFKPKVAVLLNIFEAHLDYHKTLENYKYAKANLFSNQTEEEYLVYNADDEQVNEMIKKANAKLVPFSRKSKLPNGAYADDTYIYYNNTKVMKMDDIALVGSHNLENILAAVATAKLYNVSNEAIKNVLQTFVGVAHRLQFVANKEDRLFYNDSKATNILATTKALQAFQKPIILLAGGLDRGNSFDGLKPYMSNVKGMVVFGETASKLIDLGKEIGLENIEKVNNMEEAVKCAFQLSSPNEVVLLSPACASWDQYATFEERGNMFMNSVHKL